jgi:hypothetical protein
MPLLVLQLIYDTTAGKSDILLNGGIPKQPLELVHYGIKLASADANLDYLHVKLPFLNSYDVNSNFSVSNAFPIFHVSSSTVFSSNEQCSYEFNPSMNINESISGQDWEIYSEDGTPYQTKNYTVTLVFNYRRSELI